MKRGLLDSLTNFGNPIIHVVDANHANRGELYLYHEWVGTDLQFEEAFQTLRYLQDMWKRPVHLETREEGKARLLSYDGREATMKELSGSKAPGDVVGPPPSDAR